MPCVISYWVLSGAPQAADSAEKLLRTHPAKLLKWRNVYLKLTRHNGRAGTHGTYNPKHNDRSFNLANSEHIDPERAKGNIYWDCFHGFRSVLAPPDPDDLAATFSEVERQFYETHYSEFIERQNERNAKIRHTERNRSIPDLLSSRKTCPEETIYQLGTLDEHASAEDLLNIVTEFIEAFKAKYGDHVHVLDWALHLDESTPHIHERHVFDCENKYGEVAPQQEKVLDMAVDDCYLRSNPSDNVLRELKKAHQFETNRRKALTVAEQNLLLSYLSKTPKYQHWYPIFAVMLGTGLRVGEATGLRWCDVDFEEGTISVNHTLVNYDHRENNGGKKGCYFNCHSPKTKAGVRTVPMMDFVKEAFEKERAYQEEAEIHCTVTVDGYTDFIFVNRFGECQHQGTLNKAIRRIIRDCNDEVLAKNPNSTVLLPRFSCHTLRHTFTTRMCEAGVNIKMIQDALGHSDISTTLNIYADVTKELRKSEFENLDRQFAQWKDPEE